tara:strand:+ start:461 stop:844 length:384 start_codon:yes stop_codon:yes gene_type:complete
MVSVKECSRFTWNNLFPKHTKNKAGVYLVNIIHIIGVLFIQFGLLLPYPVLKYYILFLIFVYMSYFLFQNKCFMTIISNYLAEKNVNMLCIKLKDAKVILLIYLVLAILFYLNPEYAPYNLIKSFFK